MASDENRTASANVRSLLVGATYLVVVLIVGVRIGRASVPTPTLAEFATPEEDSIRPAWSVTLVMQPADCASNTRSLEWWSALAGEGETFVSAIVVTDDPEASEAAVSNARLTFPVATVDHRGIGRYVLGLGYQATPLVILSDDLGRVRGAAPMGDFQTQEDVTAFVDRAGSTSPKGHS